MEFAGETVEHLTMEERMTLCNMAIESGGKNGTIAADQTTFDYVRSRTNKPFEAVYTDADAKFYSDFAYNVAELEPVVAQPHSPDNRALARECSDVKIDRVYIGSCTGGKTTDFVNAARILKGQKVKVPTYLVPATQKVYEDLFSYKYAGQTLSEIFLESGCIEPAAPSCAACLGGPKDTFGRMNSTEVCVSTTNRNFPGRMGEKTAQIYLASPYTAAASALTGYVTDPREFIG